MNPNTSYLCLSFIIPSFEREKKDFQKLPYLSCLVVVVFLKNYVFIHFITCLSLSPFKLAKFLGAQSFHIFFSLSCLFSFFSPLFLSYNIYNYDNIMLKDCVDVDKEWGFFFQIRTDITGLLRTLSK